EVTGVDVRREDRLVLAAQQRGGVGRKAPQHDVGGIDYDTLTLDLTRFRAVRTHRSTLSRRRLGARRSARAPLLSHNSGQRYPLRAGRVKTGPAGSPTLHAGQAARRGTQVHRPGQHEADRVEEQEAEVRRVAGVVGEEGLAEGDVDQYPAERADRS